MGLSKEALMKQKQEDEGCIYFLHRSPKEARLQRRRAIVDLPDCPKAHICMSRMKEGVEVEACPHQEMCAAWVELLIP